MKNKFVAMLSFMLIGFMLFAPAANAANTFYFNSTTGSFESLRSNGYTYNQRGDQETSLFNNIFYFFTKNQDNTTTQPSTPVNEQEQKEQQQPTTPEKPEAEQEQPKEEVQPEEPKQEAQPEQPKEEEKVQQPESEDQTNDVVNAKELKMLEYINNERAKAGVAPLQMDTEVARVAQIKSQDMVDNNYFSHTSPTYGSPFDMMKNFGIRYRAAGENIAINSTMAKAHTALMNSQGHRKNILNPNFTHIGIGIVPSGSSSGITVTQMFIGK